MSDKKVFNTYKSIWIQDLSTGNYERQQKQKYPLESFINSLAPLIKPIPKVRGLIPFLGKKAQGADFYKYYIDYIISGNRGKWTGEMEAVIKRLHELGLSLEGKSILDVSGEPGFFASDVKSLASKVVVTSFAKEVADAMTKYLDIGALTYDFNNDILSEVIKNSKFDFILSAMQSISAKTQVFSLKTSSNSSMPRDFSRLVLARRLERFAHDGSSTTTLILDNIRKNTSSI